MKGEEKCEAAARYRTELRARAEREAGALASLTGWPIEEIRRKMGPAYGAVRPDARPWWKKMWGEKRDRPTAGLKVGVPTQPVSDTSTVTPSGALYFTSTLALRWRAVEPERVVDVVAPLRADWARRSAMSSRLSTWKPM